MAYNTKNLITDAGTKQIPQFFDTAADNYYALLGTDGAGPHYVNFDTAGAELFVALNPGKVDIQSALPAGTNLLGKVGIDQTTDGTTNKVYVGNTANVQLTGSNASAHESVTITNAAGGVALTAGTYGTSIYAFITAETAQMRYTVDGTAPTTANGHLLNPGDILKLDSNADIVAFRAIRTGSVSGVIKVTYSGVA